MNMHIRKAGENTAIIKIKNLRAVCRGYVVRNNAGIDEQIFSYEMTVRVNHRIFIQL